MAEKKEQLRLTKIRWKLLRQRIGKNIIDSIQKINPKNEGVEKKLGFYKPCGLTPEGMCLNILNSYIPNSSYYLDSYLINMSDGFPTFESSKFVYKGENAILDTAKAVTNIKKKGVKVLSYFIETETNNIKLSELIKDFRIMYGKSASFIDPKNIYQIYLNHNTK